MLIAIAGNIGSGKSSLTSLLHQKFGWTPHFESVDDNPYLPDFYADMKRWSFHLQVYFLSKRFILHREVFESGNTVVQDRSIYEDAEIFANNLHSIGRMDDRDFENYQALYAAMTSYLKPPDLLIYLRADIPTLQRQIHLRGRDFEQTIEVSYLEQLNTLYEDWIHRYSLGPLLIIDSDEADFVHDMQKQEEVLYQIDHAVRNKRG
ncbi:MAG: deoxynucleoside kinase [Bacteroidota bacterium]